MNITKLKKCDGYKYMTVHVISSLNRIIFVLQYLKKKNDTVQQFKLF